MFTKGLLILQGQNDKKDKHGLFRKNAEPGNPKLMNGLHPGYHIINPLRSKSSSVPNLSLTITPSNQNHSFFLCPNLGN